MSPPQNSKTDPLVTVIIPCYNHGQYLAGAIDSVLAQDHKNFEIIVVDDGSTDNCKFVVKNYPNVKYIYQSNQGLSAARNTGIEHGCGNYLIFLDADDWLQADALSTGLHFLQQNEEIAFVSGAHIKVNDQKEIIEEVKESVAENHYHYLLQGNYIGMHATVMYRRWVFDEFRYDTSLKACEDYDLYLKVAKKFPIVHHTQLIAAYRIHNNNMSGNIPLMLNTVLKVLHQQENYLSNETEKKAFKSGLKNWKDYYCKILYSKALFDLSVNTNMYTDEGLKTLFKHNKYLFLKYHIKKITMRIKSLIKKSSPVVVQRLLHKAGVFQGFIPAPGKVNMGDFKRFTPFSKEFGYDRGGPVDRYYIENFLQENASAIHGRVLEIGDNEYTMRFGASSVLKSDILHVDANNPNATFVGDLSNAPQIADNIFDCIVLTQTLHLIYDYKGAIATCYRILKPGGVLLLTVPGISHIDQGEWGSFWLWSFTQNSITKILLEVFPAENTKVETFGNVFVATAFLYGIGLPEMKKENMDYTDPNYQVIISAKAIKPN